MVVCFYLPIYHHKYFHIPQIQNIPLQSASYQRGWRVHLELMSACTLNLNLARFDDDTELIMKMVVIVYGTCKMGLENTSLVGTLSPMIFFLRSNESPVPFPRSSRSIINAYTPGKLFLLGEIK